MFWKRKKPLTTDLSGNISVSQIPNAGKLRQIGGVPLTPLTSVVPPPVIQKKVIKERKHICLSVCNACEGSGYNTYLGQTCHSCGGKGGEYEWQMRVVRIEEIS